MERESDKSFGPLLKVLPTLFIWLWGGGLAMAAIAQSIGNTSHWLAGFWGIQEGGDQLNYALQIANGRNYFTVPNEFPMLAPLMPGLFPLLLSPFVKMFGPSLLYGNILGVACLVTTLSAVAYSVKRLSGSWLSVPVALSILLGMKRASVPMAWNRPDSLAIALAALAITFLLEAVRCDQTYKRALWWTCGSAVAAVLAVFSKQQAAAIGIGVFIALLVLKERRLAALFSLMASVLGGGTVLILQSLTKGGYWYDIWVLTGGSAVFNAFHWARNCGLMALGNLVAGAVLCISLRKRQVWQGHLQQPLRATACLLSCSAVVAVATAWHVGGSFQYFSFALLSLAFLGGISIPAHIHSVPPQCWKRLTYVALALSAGQLLLNTISPFRTLHETWFRSDKDSRAILENACRLFDATRQLKGPVFFDRLTGIAVLQGRPVEVESSVLYVLHARGFWDTRVLESAFENKRWKYVVFFGGRQDLFLSVPIFDEILRRKYRCIARMPLVKSNGKDWDAQIWEAMEW
jgi:hypothetical protein